ncbi:MAG: S24/S26 family peptidase [Bacteroidales bacterium]|nr:S24/S26 family peptidase [Candidatus Physcocola equi]
MTFEDVLNEHGVLIYENVGDSMMPLIKQGRDKMVIVRRPEGRLKKYDVPLYRRDNGKYVLHRIMEVRENDYVICGDNRWCCEEGITDRHIIGVLSAVIRNGKTVNVTDKQYQRYVFLWCRFFKLRQVIFWLRDFPFRAIRFIKKRLSL